MKRIEKTRALSYLLLLGAACLAGNSLRAQEEPADDQVQLIITYASDAERETRMVGLQFIRDDVPGEAATRKFAALLPDLSPEAQVDMLEALADRGDAVARPAVLDMLKSEAETVRTAALRALGPLGAAADVPLLSQKAAGGSDAEKKAARESMVRLHGDDVNAALLAEMEKGEPSVRVGLLAVLAGRNAKESLPVVLKSTEDPEETVRIAALEALRFLADENDTEKLVNTLKGAKDDAESRKAELALLGVCSRGSEACADAIVAGMTGADVRSRTALLHALTRAGGDKALETVVATLNDDDETVRNEAVRMLSSWSDAAAVPHLSAIAKKEENPRYQILAIRGLVRLASPRQDKPADLALLGEAMDLAKRVQEKKLVIGALSGADSPEALDMVMPATDDPALAEEARFAVVLIAGKMKKDDRDTATAALKKMFESAKNPLVPVLVIRGFVNLATPEQKKGEPEKPVNMELLGEAMKLAKRPQEKEVLLDALGTIGNAQALALVMPLTDDPKLAGAAGLAAVQIAEKMAEINKDAGMKSSDKDAVRTALEKLQKGAKNRKVRDRARKVLESLEAL